MAITNDASCLLGQVQLQLHKQHWPLWWCWWRLQQQLRRRLGAAAAAAALGVVLLMCAGGLSPRSLMRSRPGSRDRQRPSHAARRGFWRAVLFLTCRSAMPHCVRQGHLLCVGRGHSVTVQWTAGGLTPVERPREGNWLRWVCLGFRTPMAQLVSKPSLGLVPVAACLCRPGPSLTHCLAGLLLVLCLCMRTCAPVCVCVRV